MLVALKAVFVIAQAITLRGIVEDSAQRGIPYATALFVSVDRTATTDVAGRFELRLEPGTYLVRIRAIGFVPASFHVTLGPGRLRDFHFVLVRTVLELPELRVTSEPQQLAAGLYRRLLRGGAYLTGDRMVHRGMMRPSEGLQWIPGIRYEHRSMSEGGPLIGFPDCKGARSKIAVWIDGHRVMEGLGGNDRAVAMLDDIRPGDLQLMEVYKRFDEIPPEFREPDLCGAIVVWTIAAVDPG